MKVFVVGASGAIGSRLVPQLIQRGHEVIGTCRSSYKAERLRAVGARPVILDALDARAVRNAVLEARPEAVINEATALARLIAGESAVMVGTSARGASNAKAKRELGWAPRYPSWRRGFVTAYASGIPAEQRKRPSVRPTSHSPSP